MESKNEPPVHEFKVLHKGQRALHHFVTLNFGKSHFGMDLSSREHFGTCTFWHCGHSVRWTYQLFGIGNFPHHRNFSIEYFSTWTFWLMDILAPYKPIWTFWHLYYCVKCPCAEMSPCWNDDEASVLKWLLPKSQWRNGGKPAREPFKIPFR